MYRKSFVCFCRRTLMHIIFNTAYSITDLNNICKFHDPPPPPQINTTDEIDLLVENITDEIKSAVDRATTKKPANEFYKLDLHVHILTTNKNRARKDSQKT